MLIGLSDEETMSAALKEQINAKDLSSSNMTGRLASPEYPGLRTYHVILIVVYDT